MRFFLAALLAFCPVLPAPADDPASLELPGADGNPHNPLDAGDKKAVVLFFVSPFCPTANNFIPEINAIVSDHGANFAFYVIEAEPLLQMTDVLRHIEINGIEAPVLLDEDLRLAKRLGATITPEAVVLAPDGARLYQGRINDFYLAATRKQRQPTTRDLRDVLEAIEDGRPVPGTHLPAVGCRISGLP